MGCEWDAASHDANGMSLGSKAFNGMLSYHYVLKSKSLFLNSAKISGLNIQPFTIENPDFESVLFSKFH